MSDLRRLYQEVILDHNRKPRNFGPLDGANRHADGHNPLCGDTYTIHLIIEDDRVKRAAFEGEGCAISKAAASMMTAKIKGKPVQEAEVMIDQFRRLIKGELDPERDDHVLGHLAVFQGVSALPVRIKCALLPWHALQAALEGQ
ncbi:MAG: Fe-S cluster assembly sulfur transfer protein SufU, partial [Myxococcota bacterium]